MAFGAWAALGRKISHWDSTKDCNQSTPQIWDRSRNSDDWTKSSKPFVRRVFVLLLVIVIHLIIKIFLQKVAAVFAELRWRYFVNNHDRDKSTSKRGICRDDSLVLDLNRAGSQWLVKKKGTAPKEGRCVALNDVHLSKKDDSLTLFYGGPQTGSRTTFLREVGPTAIRNRLYP